MSLTTAIEQLQRILARSRTEGHGAAADLVRAISLLAEAAALASLPELARLGTIAARTIEHLARDGEVYALHAPTALRHIGQVVELAGACSTSQPAIPELEAHGAAGSPVAAAQQATAAVSMAVGGEFADRSQEFVEAARSQLLSARAALASIAGGVVDSEHLQVLHRSFHAIRGFAGMLSLGPLAELAAATEALSTNAYGKQPTFHAQNQGLLMAAADMVQELLLAIDGDAAPPERVLHDLIGALRAAARSGAHAGEPSEFDGKAGLVDEAAEPEVAANPREASVEPGPAK